MTIRLALLCVAVASSGCVTSLARMDPLAASGKDVRYRNGTPILVSHGARFDVAVSPEGGSTGRYRLDEGVVRMAVGIRNRSERRVDVSESDISASGAARPARVLSAAEAEDSSASSPAVEQTLGAIAGTLQGATPARPAIAAGYAATAGYLPNRARPYKDGGVKQASREEATDAVATADALPVKAAPSTQVDGLFQRTTIEPGDTYVGAVFIERNAFQQSALQRSGEPSRIGIFVNVDGEVHTFDFNEVAQRVR
jgi:hypothetical protein